MTARVSLILQRKGAAVATLDPAATLAEAAAIMTEHGIGSLVVSGDGRTVEGVIAERDLIQAIARHGPAALQLRVGEVAEAGWTICGLDTHVDELVVTMTEQRVRHIPVVDGGRLVGIVSIGDVVKWRMDELTMEARQLEAYVSGAY